MIIGDDNENICIIFNQGGDYWCWFKI